MRTQLWCFGVVYFAHWGDQLTKLKYVGCPQVRAITEAIMVAWVWAEEGESINGHLSKEGKVEKMEKSQDTTRTEKQSCPKNFGIK